MHGIVGLLLLVVLWPNPADGQTRRERAVNRQLLAGVEAYEDGLYDAAQRFFQRALDQAATDHQIREARLWLLRALFRSGNFEDLLKQLDSLLLQQADPASVSIYRFWRAHARYAQGQYAEAIEELNHVDPEQLDAAEAGRRLRMFGRAYIRTGRFDSASRVLDLYDRQFSQAPGAAENRLDRVDLLLQTGETDRAIEQLNELITDFPDAGAAQVGRLWLALLHLQREHYEDARMQLQYLTQSDVVVPEIVADAWAAWARIHEIHSDWNAAEQALLRVAESAPDLPARRLSSLNRARMLFQLADWEGGRAVLQPLIEDRLDGSLAAEAQLWLAESWLDQHRYEDALAAYQAYLNAFDDAAGRARAFLGRAWSLLGLERPAEAAASFEQAYRLHDQVMDRAQAWFKMADAYFLQGNYARARREYLFVAGQFMDSTLVPTALFQAAESSARSGELIVALDEFEAIEAQYPGSLHAAKSAMRVGSLHEEQGQWERAIAAYQRVVQQYQEADLVAAALHRRGLIQYRLGFFEAALIDFDAVLDKYPGLPEAEQAFYMRGWCLYLLGEDQRALQVAESFLERYPDSPWRYEVLFWLATYHFNHEQFTESEKRFLTVANAAPNGLLSDRALFWAARSAAALESYRDAIEHVSRLTRIYPRSGKMAEARLLQGDALIQLGEFAGAILAFEELIRSTPDSLLAVSAWGRKGDAQFTLGAETPARYEEALVAYQTVMDHPQATPSLRVQAEFKLGRTLEQMGRAEEALDRYLQVVYDFHQAPDTVLMAEAGIWFSRAAFSAAQMREAAGDVAGAVQLYERVAALELPAAPDARRRISQLLQTNARR
jgi:TolA-binding protein